MNQVTRTVCDLGRTDPQLAGMFKGLPDESCPCPHWGYLFTGKITVTYPDHEAGDASYMSPGHVPAAEMGSEFVQFGPADALAEVRAPRGSRTFWGGWRRSGLAPGGWVGARRWSGLSLAMGKPHWWPG